ncbi:MAG: hypothetical protein K0S08_569 [Gammaproteobacteria bacterium]|jgi:hypothetical protein|nr:hypothetical protein [Gammaproteobacteria bacterium]
MLETFGEYKKILETLINAKLFFYQTNTLLFQEWAELCDRGLYTLQIATIFQRIAQRHHLSERHTLQNLLLAFLETATTPFELYTSLCNHPQKTILIPLIEALNRSENHSALIRMQTQFQSFAASQTAYEQRVATVGEQKIFPAKAPPPASIAHTKQTLTSQMLPALTVSTKEKPKELASLESEIPKLPKLVKPLKPSDIAQTEPAATKIEHAKSPKPLAKKDSPTPSSPAKIKLGEAQRSPPLRAKHLPPSTKAQVSRMSFLLAAQEAAQKDREMLAAGQKVLSRYIAAQRGPLAQQQHSPPPPITSRTKEIELPLLSLLCIRKISR